MNTLNEEKNKGTGAAPEWETPEPPERRRFLVWLWSLLGGAVLAETLWVVSSFFRPKNRQKAGEDSIVVAGPIDRFEEGSVTAFQGGKFYLAHLPGSGFLAMSRECTHLGCTVAWDEKTQRFVCPCHASAFDIHGAVLSTPAPRPLDLLAVRIENRVVKVDTASRRRRSSFEEKQVSTE